MMPLPIVWVLCHRYTVGKRSLLQLIHGDRLHEEQVLKQTILKYPLDDA